MSACWHPCREGQINAFDRAQKKAVQFTNRTKYSDWENLAQRRTTAHLCALLKPTVGNGLGKLYATGCEVLYYLSRVDHVLENWGQEAKDGYQFIFLCKQGN